MNISDQSTQTHLLKEIIIAWANGKTIQYKTPESNWFDLVIELGDFEINRSIPNAEWRIKPEKVTGWLNIYSNFDGVASYMYATKEIADEMATSHRIACIQISYTPGEGL